MEHYVLLIEDDPAIARVIQEALAGARGGPFIVEWVRQLSDGLESLKKESNNGGLTRSVPAR